MSVWVSVLMWFSVRKRVQCVCVCVVMFVCASRFVNVGLHMDMDVFACVVMHACIYTCMQGQT